MDDFPAPVALSTVLSSVLTASVSGEARPALLATITRIPAPRTAPDDLPPASRD
jgi:hypothetical protein